MTTVRDLSLVRVAFDPWTTASNALRELERNGLALAAVVDRGVPLGLLTRERAAASAPDVPVRTLVQPDFVVIDADTSVRSAAATLVDVGAEVAVVTEGGRFLGAMTALVLLAELGQSYDPLTGLSWGDRLREWGVANLEAGREVTLLFFDLNDFGAYNKRHGHVIGDRIVQAMARLLDDYTDPELDVLVRYAGDEFVIGSTRPRADLEEMAEALRSKTLRVEGIQESVQYSLGVSGGKRTRERDRTHFASTIDNLINLASQDCIAHKPQRARNGGSEETPAHLHVQSVEFGDAGRESVLVALGRGEESVTSRRPVARRETLSAVAQACADGIARFMPGLHLQPLDIAVYRDIDGDQTLTLVCDWTWRDASGTLRGSSNVAGSVLRSVAEAMTSVAIRLQAEGFGGT
ncbi:MAG: diguanylate cyclase [Fimbriimonadaceae bacterium]|nr:diguanylate cyclase [Fimbriimonadaceae bacterium]QYK56792.1 MAG: diguanylate cyclase [Fimbriimonadaceae bacterium]